MFIIVNPVLFSSHSKPTIDVAKVLTAEWVVGRWWQENLLNFQLVRALSETILSIKIMFFSYLEAAVVQSVQWISCRMDESEVNARFLEGAEMFLLFMAPRPAPGSTQPLIRGYQGTFQRAKLPERQTHHCIQRGSAVWMHLVIPPRFTRLRGSHADRFALIFVPFQDSSCTPILFKPQSVKTNITRHDVRIM